MSTEEATPESVPLQREVGPLCSSCRFPLDEYTAGQRHFGTHTAHAEWYCIQRLCNEVDRLSASLKAANDQAERFERGWYLRGDALESIKQHCEPQPSALAAAIVATCNSGLAA